MKTLRLARAAGSTAPSGRMQSSRGSARETPNPRRTCRRSRSQLWERKCAIGEFLVLGGVECVKSFWLLPLAPFWSSARNQLLDRVAFFDQLAHGRIELRLAECIERHAIDDRVI